MKKTIKGKFEVKAIPQTADEATQKLGAMRMNFEKRFAGELEGTSLVVMIGLMDQDLGSGAYVALEKVTGRINGRQGTFCLQHCSSLSRGKPTQLVQVVPDSGTGELAGLWGTMIIDIVDDDHFYTFEYE